MKTCTFRASLLLSFILYSGLVFGQGFPWDEFKPRTLKEIAGMEGDVDKRDQKENNVVFHANILSSRVRVTYTGTSRAISKTKTEMIRNWCKSMGQTKEYADSYESEFLFIEDSLEYWLPVQKKVSAYFDKELTKGDAIDLYLVRAGGIRTAGKWDWMLLVEEFQKPKV